MEKTFIQRLTEITAGCRDDMHEPDEQGLSAVVQGDHLDNAFGNSPPERNCGEFTVGLTRNGVTEWFNLANLIALARFVSPHVPAQIKGLVSDKSTQTPTSYPLD